MDIYLTDLETGDRFRFPMLPERISVSLGNEFASYSILGIGTVKAPSGQSLDLISWEGIFPGEGRKDMPLIREWQNPQEAFRWIENCKVVLPTAKKLNLLVTETAINVDVYLDSFTNTYSGGMGDIGYQISFVQGKDLTVTATSVGSSSTDSETKSDGDSASTEDNRTNPPMDTTYTVVKGDSLWKISQSFWGEGARYGELYQANQTTIDSENAKYGNSKYTIYPGQVFTIP
ncbi:MAG: LysM peptidoglycan-binding domain-containing protein [Eubacteriales bacterium]